MEEKGADVQKKKKEKKRMMRGNTSLGWRIKKKK